MIDFNKLNRETWNSNNIGNTHHHTNVGIKHPTNFSTLNRETYSQNNKISVHSIYESMGRNW